MCEHILPDDGINLSILRQEIRHRVRAPEANHALMALRFGKRYEVRSWVNPVCSLAFGFKLVGAGDFNEPFLLPDAQVAPRLRSSPRAIQSTPGASHLFPIEI